MKSHVYLLVLQALFVVAHCLSADQIAPLFQNKLSDEAVITYGEVNERWSVWEKPEFKLTIKPATEKDVQTIVKIASWHRIPFLATGDNHGVSLGLGSIENAINIDLSNFISVDVDAQNNLLTVGGAANFSRAIGPLYEAGKILQIGNAPCVNLVGATIGAGVGPNQGQYGLIIDALVSVRLVTASGHLIEVSEKKHSDLFWAIKGAGANFGIITYAKYLVHDAPNGGDVVNADFIWPSSANESLWNLLQSWDDNISSDVGLALTASYNRQTGQGQLSGALFFNGPQEGARPYIDALLALGPTRFENSTIPWNQLPDVSGFGSSGIVCLDGRYVNTYSVGLGKADPDMLKSAFSDLVEFSENTPGYTGQIVIQRYSNEVALTVDPKKGGVYPWRDIKHQVLLLNFYPNSTLDSEVDPFMLDMRSKFHAASGFDDLHVYLNYGHGDEGPEVWFGKKNLPRLSRLKKLWDPRNLFGAGHPIPMDL